MNEPGNALNTMHQNFAFVACDLLDPEYAFVENAFDVLEKA